MAHFKIKVADLLVDVVAKGELTARICEPYLVDSAFTDISIYATPAQIKKKIASMPIPLTEASSTRTESSSLESCLPSTQSAIL